MGQPGTGKTHIALAIGILAVNKGYRVYSTSLKKLANATITRIFDRAEIIIFKGNSYRMKGKIKINDVDLNDIKN